MILIKALKASQLSLAYKVLMGLKSEKLGMVDRRRRPQLGASIADKLALYFCKTRSIGGLWVGATKSEQAERCLNRVEKALNVIKQYDPLQYIRVLRYLDRVWVCLEPNARGCFRASLNACILDERYVLAEATTPEDLAATIVHEATHARIDHWGVEYSDVKERLRIEAVCMRRELAFSAKLPQSKPLQEQVDRKMEWCAANPEYFSNASFYRRGIEGQIEALRYLRVPEWLIQGIMKLKMVISATRRVFHSNTGG